MSDARTTSYRIRMIVALAIAILLALASFWLLDVMRRSTDDALPSVKRSDPDYYVDSFRVLRLDQRGKTRYRIDGERLTHNPQDDSHDILQPRLISLSDNQPPLTIRAERAHGNRDNSQVHLYDKVEMDRPAFATGAHLHMQTEYLLVLPDDEIMKTHLPVTLVSGTDTLTGTGMVANNATRTLHLASRVRGRLAPRPGS
ncbi:MAG: LPS export ABC transporter periplasmic protein LptC [Proteobacteria bacterium]|nr:LPS export ABC transporter periplasmic protein LptC [Pseudomonadota bacterium]